LAIRALEGVQLEGPEKDILREICQGNQKGDQEEPVAKAAKELQQASSKMVCSAEWSEDKELLCFRDKIYVSQNLDLQRRVVLLCHDMKVTGHPGHWKTLELVSRDYWWPQMSRYIRQYVSTCDLCIRTKPIRQALVGELHPLQIPDSRWDTLSVDFVVELPHDMKRYYDQQKTLAPVFKPGDKVFLDASDIRTTHPSQKLSHQRLGPFVVER